MCEKTKTVFGCGHSVKTLQDCGKHCQNPNRWSFEKSKDCSACKAGGSSISRGAEGRGRYGRQITQISGRHVSETSQEAPQINTEDAVESASSPWADTEHSNYKSWDSPTRRKADEAWLAEHGDRMSDLQEKIHKMSFSPREDSPSTLHDSYERIVEIEEDDDDDVEHAAVPKELEAINGRKIIYELSDDSDRYASKSSRRTTYSRRRRRVDSEDSMPHYAESPRSKVIYAKPTNTSNAYEYDVSNSYDSVRRSSHRRGPKTEPSYSRSIIYDSPISGSPHSAGHFARYERIHVPRFDDHHSRVYSRDRY